MTVLGYNPDYNTHDPILIETNHWINKWMGEGVGAALPYWRIPISKWSFNEGHRKFALGNTIVTDKIPARMLKSVGKMYSQSISPQDNYQLQMEK